MCLRTSRTDFDNFIHVDMRVRACQMPGSTTLSTQIPQEILHNFQTASAPLYSIPLSEKTQRMVTSQLKLLRHKTLRVLLKVWEVFLKILTFGCYKTHRSRTLHALSHALLTPFYTEFVSKHLKEHTRPIPQGALEREKRAYCNNLSSLMHSHSIDLAAHLFEKYRLVDTLQRTGSIPQAPLQTLTDEHNRLSKCFDGIKLSRDHSQHMVTAAKVLNEKYQGRLLHLLKKHGNTNAFIDQNPAHPGTPSPPPA